MQTMIATFVVVGVAMLAMAVGVIFAGKRLRGSCGGNPDSDACSCSEPKRNECRARMADEEFEKPKDRYHLDMVDR